ncbi:hypothetical protein KKA00_11940 [bacterium]|nr:hypothetical protein [bacterium]MBU1652926.1 hypothetical protein [bacterium]MBU1882367.1 hypothetical protein [bacterium]
MISSNLPAKKLNGATEESAPQLKGICLTCIYVPGCLHMETPDNPKMFCEQFETELKPLITATDTSILRSVAAVFEKEAEAIKQAKTLGLCVNCSHLDTCKYPRPEGGIWHCEEYC